MTFPHPNGGDRFDRHFDKVDKVMSNPGKSFLKLGVIALIINLIFWLVIIGAVIFGLSLVF